MLLISVSCSEVPSPGVVLESKTAPRTNTTPKAPSLWYDQITTRYDFGLILAGSDMTRTHTFRVENISGLPVRIKGVVNRKPCCGEVAPIAASVLDPGQFVEVAVTLHIGLSAGQILHVAAIETQGDGDDSGVDLFTSATAHARATVEDGGPGFGPLDPGQSRKIKFIIRSFGKAGDSPTPLDDRAIRCGLATEWVGPPTTRADAETGLDEIRRTLAVTLPASPGPGTHSKSLEVLNSKGGIVGRRWINWVIPAALKASPAGLIFTSEAQATEGFKVVVTTHDRRPFRIASATTEVEGLQVVIDGDDARPTHLLSARFGHWAHPSASRAGEIAIRTDHPGQPVLKVAVFVTAQGTSGPERDAPEKSR